MAVVLGIRQNLGVFQEDLPAILSAMNREEKTTRTQVGKYTVLDLKEDPPFPQKGSFKTIYYCVSKPLGAGDFIVHVALRCDRFNAAFQREKGILSILKGAKGVLQPLCIQTIGDFEYMISELFNRGNLYSFIMDRGFSVETFDAHWIGYSIVSAVSECHAKGIVLRDLKPENILVRQLDDGSFEVKLIDFGLSCALNEENTAEKNKVCGSFIYFPPEELKFYLANGSLPAIEYARDTWALGSILFTLATKNFPVKILQLGPRKIEKILYPPEPETSLGLFDLEIRDLLYLPRKDRPTARSIEERISGIFADFYPTKIAHQRSNMGVLYSPPPGAKQFLWRDIEVARPSLEDKVDELDLEYRMLSESFDVATDPGNAMAMKGFGGKPQSGAIKPRSLFFRLCCCFR